MSLQDKRVALFVDQMYNEYEYIYPKYRLMEAGAEVITVASEANATYPSKHGLPAVSDAAYTEIRPDDISAVVIPGGFAPDFIRRNQAAIDLTANVFSAGKPVAYICHAGWVAASAGILKGRRATSFIAIRDDVSNAGAEWVDEPVVVDGNLISSRKPDDLPYFLQAIIGALQA